MKGPITDEYLLHRGKRKSLNEIKSLDLSNHDLTSIDSNLFNKLTSLEALDISWNRLSDIPADLKLGKLRVLDCSNNKLHCVDFVQQFKQLEELYIDDNQDLTIDHEYIVKVLCPKLRRLDTETDLHNLDRGRKLYTEQLTPQIEAVWEAKYAEVYSGGIDASEKDKLLNEFVKTFIETCVGFHKDLPKFREFMIRRISLELMNRINSSKENKVTRNSSEGETPNSKYRTRVKMGNTPLKDYSQGVPMDVNDCDNKVEDKVNSRKRKRESLSEDSPALKRKRSVTPEKTLVNKKVKRDHVECTILKKKEELNKVTLPPLPDYDPVKFIRCHSSDNDPSDADTKVWKCAFEPSIAQKGETSETIATCGGRIVCLLDCHTCKVIKRYKDNSDSESFYCLAWTTLPADGDKLNEDASILAVAGQDGEVKLMYPRQLVKYATLTGHRDYVSSLLFHPRHNNILFSASRDGRIIQWDIGVPDFNNYKAPNWSKLTSLCLDNTDAISMVITPKLNTLLAGCENSCFGWRLGSLKGTENIKPDFEFVHPREQDEIMDKKTVDSLCVLQNKYIVSKCVGNGTLYVWIVEQHIEGQKKSRIAVKPLYQLNYVSVEVDYLYASTCKDNLIVGDDEGNIRLYNLKQALQQKQHKQDTLYQASCILRNPEAEVEPKFASTMKDVTDEQDMVINCVALSSNQKYLVCGTDNNLVCVWKRAST